MKTRELQTLWWDWLSTSERLLSTLQDQTKALMRRDVGTIDRLQNDLDSMLAHMKMIDDQAAVSARRLAEELGAQPHLRSLVENLSKAEGQQVQGLANRVKAAAASVSTHLDKNRKLIENELVYVNGSLALIVRASQDQESQFGGKKPSQAVLVNQVA
jgi:hypothetical protein